MASTSRGLPPENRLVPPLDLGNTSKATDTSSSSGRDSSGRKVRRGRSQKTTDSIERLKGAITPPSPSSSHSIPSSSREGVPHQHSLEESLSLIIQNRIMAATKNQMDSLTLMDKMSVLKMREEVAEFIASKPTKEEAIAYLTESIQMIGSNPVFDSLISEYTQLMISIKTMSDKTYKNVIINYKKIIAPGAIAGRSFRIEQMQIAKADYEAASAELRALSQISLSHLAKTIAIMIEEMRSPQMSDFKGEHLQLESQLSLEALKDLLLDPTFVHVDRAGVQWRGGTIEPLPGGSGGVYAAGLQTDDQPPQFKKLLVMKVMSEEPGNSSGSEQFHPDLMQEIRLAERDPYMRSDYPPIRVGIAPGKGVLNERLASITVFGDNPVAIAKIRHPLFKEPAEFQTCCLISYLENEGDFESLSNAQGLIDQALFAFEEADSEMKLVLEKKLITYRKQLETANKLKIAQGSSIASIEERIELTNFEKLMALHLLTRNQDAQAQNLLLVKGKEGYFLLKGVDNGAIFSSLFQTKDFEHDLPGWCTLKIAKEPISLNPSVRLKLMQLNADDLIHTVRRVYRDEGLKVDVGQQLTIRASVALLKSSLKRVDLTFEQAARLTFLRTSDNYHNALERAVKLCDLRVQRDLDTHKISEEEKNRALDGYLLSYFEQGFERLSLQELHQIGFEG